MLQTYAYCIYSADKFCTEGPYTRCQGDGILSNNCPYGSSSSAQPPSSSSIPPSSSSSTSPSSSSVVPSSSSVSSSSSSQQSSSSSTPPSSSSVVSSSSSVPTQSSVIRGTPVTYAGETYETVVIGTQTWMARNLNYNASGSKCYGEGGTVFVDGVYIKLSNTEIQANCGKYGRLYDWAMAMNLPSNCNSTRCTPLVSTKYQGICPSGWHIPSNDEWEELKSYVESENGCRSCAGKHLKSKSDWKDGGNGLDTYGFSALPGGNGSDSSFFRIGNSGYWRTATELGSDLTFYQFMYFYGDGVYRISGDDSDSDSKSPLLSVRCLQD